MIPHATSIEAINQTIQTKDLVFLYCSNKQCNVCKSLLPKIEELLTAYPDIHAMYIDLEEIPFAAGQFSVFTIPTVLFFAEGNETFRYARSFGIPEIKSKIDRLIELFN